MRLIPKGDKRKEKATTTKSTLQLFLKREVELTPVEREENRLE